MANLIKIGDSQSVVIPDSLIEKTDLVGKELEFNVFGTGLLVTALEKPRQGWQHAIAKALNAEGNVSNDNEWLSAELTENEESQW